MPIHSTFPPIEIPDVDIWGLLFERKNQSYPENKVIYVDPYQSRSYTYAQVKSTAIDFAKGLKALWEWKKGDVLAFYSPNCIDTPPLTWGCHWAGGVITPANPAYTAEELAFQLKDSKAKAIVTQLAFLETARKAANLAGISEEYICLMGDERDPGARFKHFTSIRNISGTNRYRRAKINASEDLAFLAYSSGTTGLPKGVMLTHRNIVSNILQIKVGEAGNLGWNNGPDGSGDRVLAFLPFFHIYGLTCLLHQALFTGLTLIVMPKFDLETFCKFVQDYKVTFSYVVPPVILLLSKHPLVDNYNLSSLRMLNSGAAPLTRELVEALYQRLKIPVKQGYGLSETSPTTHMQAWDQWDKAIGSVGQLAPNMTAKYISEGREVPAGEVGELWLKGPNIFKGYLNKPDLTADCLTADGYFQTGDVGYQDKNGNFFITDRVKELIKYKGFQVPPAELEGLLVSHPKVDDAAVIGVYVKEQATEVPLAYIVLAQGVERNSKTAEELTSWMASKVAPHKKLRGGIKFVDAIPKSASGKLLRRVLKEMHQNESKLAAKL